MRRHLRLAIAVLSPFAGLVGLGFSLLKEPPQIDGSDLAEPRALEPLHSSQLPQPVAVVPSPLPEPPVKPRLPSMLGSVEPLVQECFRDVSDRVQAPIRVTVGFDATGDGGFADVAVQKISWQDPHLSACILDAFEDARFEPTGVGLRGQLHTFAFDAGR